MTLDKLGSRHGFQAGPAQANTWFWNDMQPEVCIVLKMS